MADPRLADLLALTKDGEWGKDAPAPDVVPMRVIRGTDFQDVRHGSMSNVPLRYIPTHVASRKQLQSGDILIETAGGTKDQPTGRTVLLKQRLLDDAGIPLVCASFSRFLRVNRELIDPDYLFWYLQHLYKTGEMYPYHVQHTGVARFQYTQFANQTVIPRLGTERERSLAILLNPLDEKIALNAEMNETLESLARSLFNDWFTEFGPTREKMAGRPRYLSSEIWEMFPSSLDERGIPEAWEQSEIGKEARCVGGTTPSTTDSSLWNGGIPWATPRDLSLLKTPVLSSTERTISPAGLDKIGSGLLPIGSVLLSSRAPIGYLAITEIPVAINQGFIGLICDGRLTNVFIWQWLAANTRAILQMANGSTFQEISKTNFRPLPVVVPPTPLREAFEALVRPLYDQIRVNESETRMLSHTRDFLLPRLISGEASLDYDGTGIEVSL